MARVRYVPSAPDDNQECTVFGATFSAGKWSTVTDDLAVRLDGNPTFDTKGIPDAPEDAPAPTED